MEAVQYGEAYKLLCACLNIYSEIIGMVSVQGNLSISFNSLWIKKRQNVHTNEQMEPMFFPFCACCFPSLFLWKRCLFSIVQGKKKRWKNFPLANAAPPKLKWFVWVCKSNWYFILQNQNLLFDILRQGGLISPLKLLSLCSSITCITVPLYFEIIQNDIPRLI